MSNIICMSNIIWDIQYVQYQYVCPDCFKSPTLDNSICTLPMSFGSLYIEATSYWSSLLDASWSIKLSIISMMIVFITFWCRWAKTRWSCSHCGCCRHHCCYFETITNTFFEKNSNVTVSMSNFTVKEPSDVNTFDSKVAWRD